MPQAAAIAAAWVADAIYAATVTVVGATTATAVSAAVGGFVAALGFASGIGAAVSAWATVGLVAAALLDKPKIGGIGDGGGTQVDWKANPNAGVPLVIGRTGTAGVIVHMNTDGQVNKNVKLLSVTVLSAGPIFAVESFLANDQLVFASPPIGDSSAVTGQYANAMDMRIQAGEKPSGVFLYPSSPPGTLPEWTDSHKLSGLAAAWWALNFNQTIYPNGVPKPTWVVDGPWVYDPRQDSTYPGGAGPQRWNDEATWGFVGNDNPYLQALTWCIGRRANGKLTHGLGANPAFIDIDAFVEGANVAEANAWKAGGVVASTDKKWDVLVALLQAGGGQPMRLGGFISCVVQTPRVSLATITGSDVVGRASITGTRSRRDRFNRVVPRYRSEDHRWEIVDAAPITVDDYVTEDGGQRTKEIEFPLVQNVDQAAQLSRYAIEDARELEPIVLPMSPRFTGYKAGDCLTVDEPEFGLNGQKCLIVKREIDPGSGVATLTMRSETDGKHPFALGQTGTPPPTPSLTGVDPTIVAPPADFVAVGGQMQGASGTIPALFVTGTVDNPNASEILVRFRPTGGTDFTYWPAVDAGGLGAVKTIAITGVADQTFYDVHIAYRNRFRAVSTWVDLGSHEAGVLSAGDIYNFLWTIKPNLDRFDAYVPSNGAATVIPYTAHGSEQEAITIPGGAAAVYVTRTATRGLAHLDGAAYNQQFLAWVDSGTATLRAGFRTTGGGATISDVADQSFALTTTPTVCSWTFIHSDQAGFAASDFELFTNSTTDIPAGRTVYITDLMNETDDFFAPRGLTTPWRPSPDEDDLTRYTALIQSLIISAREASPRYRLAVTKDGIAHEWVPPGPSWSPTITGTSRTVNAGDIGAMLVADNASLVTITLPPDSGAPIPAHAAGAAYAKGAGGFVFAPGAGVTLSPKLGGSFGSSGQFDTVQWVKVSANTYVLI